MFVYGCKPLVFVYCCLAGKYSIEVRSTVDHSILLRAPEQIDVVPPPMRKSELGRVFQDFEQMLQFDI